MSYRRTFYDKLIANFNQLRFSITEPIKEDHPFNNKNFYGATKICGEAMLRSFYHRYNLNYVGLRYMNVYGPRQDYHGAYIAVIMKMLDAIDNHIQTYLTSDVDTDKHTPALGFADFAEKNQKLIEETVKMLSQKDAEKDAEKDHGGDVVIDKSANLITSDEASKKIKKTYKNRYFVAVRRKGM